MGVSVSVSVGMGVGMGIGGKGSFWQFYAIVNYRLFQYFRKMQIRYDG